jgi:hypothetical protein
MIMGRSHSLERDGAHHREGPATPAGAGHPGQMMIVERVAVLSFGEVGHGDFAAQPSTRPRPSSPVLRPLAGGHGPAAGVGRCVPASRDHSIATAGGIVTRPSSNMCPQ